MGALFVALSLLLSWLSRCWRARRARRLELDALADAAAAAAAVAAAVRAPVTWEASARGSRVTEPLLIPGSDAV